VTEHPISIYLSVWLPPDVLESAVVDLLLLVRLLVYRIIGRLSSSTIYDPDPPLCTSHHDSTSPGSLSPSS
jgi:hypothetical protein